MMRVAPIRFGDRGAHVVSLLSLYNSASLTGKLTHVRQGRTVLLGKQHQVNNSLLLTDTEYNKKKYIYMSVTRCKQAIALSLIHI